MLVGLLIAAPPLMDEAEVAQCVGFAGPVGLKDVRMVGDIGVRGLVNFVTGANKADAHLTNVNWGRDVDLADWTDLLLVAGGDPCPRCDGKGRLRNVCPTCHGDGRLSRSESVEVRIPPGAQSGSRLRVAGKGNAGTHGAPTGDLYITLRVEPHPFFRRDGDDIEITVPVRIDEAGLGTKIEVPTIDGRALLKIPQGTKNGQKFRLREKGVLNARSNKRGESLLVSKFEIQTYVAKAGTEPGVDDGRSHTPKPGAKT